jgi:hypothetical protein
MTIDNLLHDLLIWLGFLVVAGFIVAYAIIGNDDDTSKATGFGCLGTLIGFGFAIFLIWASVHIRIN